MSDIVVVVDSIEEHLLSIDDKPAAIRYIRQRRLCTAEFHPFISKGKGREM